MEMDGGPAMNREQKERKSRREFVIEIAGAAVAGALVTAPCLCPAFAAQAQDASGTGAKKPAEGTAEKLVAPCGLYCGACPMYLSTQENNDKRMESLIQQFSAGKMQMKREDLLCDGCIAGGRVASFCRRCAIRSCAEAKPDVTRCSDCAEFPCARITNFNNDGMTHHSEVLENLRHLREMGLGKWTQYEQDRWRCPKCKESLSWYDKACQKCGTARSEKLFRLKQA
jgi:hypothetical protein